MSNNQTSRVCKGILAELFGVFSCHHCCCTFTAVQSDAQLSSLLNLEFFKFTAQIWPLPVICKTNLATNATTDEVCYFKTSKPALTLPNGTGHHGGQAILMPQQSELLCVQPCVCKKKPILLAHLTKTDNACRHTRIAGSDIIDFDFLQSRCSM